MPDDGNRSCLSIIVESDNQDLRGGLVRMGNLWRRHRLVLALASLLQVVAVSTARAQDQAGSITAVAGSATLERAGRQADAAIGMPVRVHDRLQTAADSSLTVTLLSGDEL